MCSKLKVVVLGGSGFIGSQVCLRLLNKGHEVICIDNFSTGCKKNMLEFLFNPLFHFIIHDITTPITIAGIDVVIYSALPDLRDPLHFLKTASYGAFTAAGIARRNNAMLICLSSYKAYGGLDNYPEEETIHISSPDIVSYGVNILESILTNYSNLKIKVLRLYDVYGPKMNNQSFIYASLLKIYKDEELIIPFHPASTLCSCYIDDVVDAVCCAMEVYNTETIYNIGTSEIITLEEFFSTARKICESKKDIIYSFKNISDVYNTGQRANTSKAKDSLKWKHKIDYFKGISKIFSFIKNGPDRDY